MPLPGDRLIILRGFGVFFGQAGVGGIFLPRYEFLPCYTELAQPESPPWTTSDLPYLDSLQPWNQNQCAQLTHDLIDWIVDYEADVTSRLGLNYRDQTLTEWKDGEKLTFAAEHFGTAWRHLAMRLDDRLESIMPLACSAPPHER